MRGSRKFCQRGSNFDNGFFFFFFLVDEGGRILIPLLVGHFKIRSREVTKMKQGTASIFIRETPP